MITEKFIEIGIQFQFNFAIPAVFCCFHPFLLHTSGAFQTAQKIWQLYHVLLCSLFKEDEHRKSRLDSPTTVKPSLLKKNVMVHLENRD